MKNLSTATEVEILIATECPERVEKFHPGRGFE
jgi:hypothetical protein